MLKNNRDCSGKMDAKYDMAMNKEYMMEAGYGAMGYVGCGEEALPGVVCSPVYECPQERVCHRTICHEVPHICPCNTRIVNHHVYRHTFTPCYSCCEENVVSNVYDGCCNRY